jgi:hypothetical protein
MQVTFLASYLFLAIDLTLVPPYRKSRGERRRERRERERTAGNGNGVYDQKCRTGLIDDMEKQETKWIGVNETSMAAVNIKGKLKKTRARISERQEREVEEEEHS